VVLVDPLERPERIGLLRWAGLIGDGTQVVAVGIDHRVRSEAELTRRLGLWGVQAVPDGTVLDTALPVAAIPEQPRRALLLGGSRSGKSAEAELRLAADPHVTYIATGPRTSDEAGDTEPRDAGDTDPRTDGDAGNTDPRDGSDTDPRDGSDTDPRTGGDAGDVEWVARVRAHRERRPSHWTTLETTDLARAIREATTPLLVDGLGTWLAAVFDEHAAWDGDRAPVVARCDELVAAWRSTAQRVVAVSDEVGMGVVPATTSGRAFRDALGRLNERLAAESEYVALVVAGRPLPL
jgi:adenosylcobinamide kinase/adenosylcobinamide-phosphate guanylyltransferase